MTDSPLRLQDRTVLLTGPFHGITQAMLRTMTEFGSNVAYLEPKATHAATYAESINDLREVHPEYGRAAHFPLPLDSPAEMTEALGRITEGFGRVDIWLDTSPLSWTKSSEEFIQSRRQLVECVLPFLLAKQKGRILYLFEDQSLEALNAKEPVPLRDALIELIKEMALAQKAKNITINGIALGVTEDFILKAFPKAGSIRKGLDELKGSHPDIKLVESTDIAMCVAFLASAVASALTGQVVQLTHGLHLKH